MEMKTIGAALKEIYNRADNLTDARHIYNSTRDYIMSLSEDWTLLDMNVQAYDSALARLGVPLQAYTLYVFGEIVETIFSRLKRRELVHHYTTVLAGVEIEPREGYKNGK